MFRRPLGSMLITLYYCDSPDGACSPFIHSARVSSQVFR